MTENLKSNLYVGPVSIFPRFWHWSCLQYWCHIFATNMWHDGCDAVSHVTWCLGRCVTCDIMPGTLCHMWHDAWYAVSNVTWWLGRCVTCDMMAGTLCHMWHDGWNAMSHVTWYARTLCHMWHDGWDAVSRVTWCLGRCVRPVRVSDVWYASWSCIFTWGHGTRDAW